MFKGRDIYWLVGTLLLVFLFLLPMAIGRHGIFVDDERLHNYPNQLFQARYLQQGIIPLWDPHTFAGGLPFYTRAEDYAFYPVQWLAGLIGETAVSFRSFQDLVIFPIVGHILWAAFGAFVLGRWGLKLCRGGSSALALTFALSTSMLAGVLMHPMVFSLAWFPWLISIVLLYSSKPSAGRLVFGACIVALSGPTYANYIVQGLMLALLFGVIVTVRSMVKTRFRSGLRLGGGLLLMGILGLFLAAPYWLAVIKASQYVFSTFKIDYNFLTSGPRSMPWRWLPTIFIPEVFGSTNFAFIWGAAKDYQMYWCEGHLTQGMLIWLPAALAIWATLKLPANKVRRLIRTWFHGTQGEKRKSFDPEINPKNNGLSLDLWTWVGVGLLIFSVLMMLGRFSPFYGFIYRLGFFFRIPYATRWYTVFSIGLAILTGIGVHRLLVTDQEKEAVSRPQLIGYIIIITLFGVIAVVLPIGYFQKLPDVAWFLKIPVLYWLICAGLIAGLCMWWPRHWRNLIIVLFALVGLLRSASWCLYRPMGFTWCVEQDPASGPEESKLYHFMQYASRYDTDPLERMGYSQLFMDNGALVYGGNSLLGVGVKPMIPRLYHTLAEICDGLPNFITLRNPGLPFVKNMSTRAWWYDDSFPLPETWEYVTESPYFNLHLFRIPDALPRIFTLNRFQTASESDSRHGLIYSDFHDVILVDKTDQTACGYVDSQESSSPEEPRAGHFALLQKKNPLRRVDFSNPNKVEIEVDITVPSMLVMTDVFHPGWTATDNGRPVTIHRVNHIQRGIWLDRGAHNIRMSFLPECITVGRWFSLAGLAICLFLLIFSKTKKLRNNNRTLINREIKLG